MGVDPGLTRCGVGIVDSLSGHKVQFVAAGVIRTQPTRTVDLRLLGVQQGIEQWLDEFQPDVMAVERVFSQHNLSTVMGTAQAAGIAITSAARRGIPVAWHTPSEIKAAVTGSGRADKPQVQFMVQRILHLAEAPTPADAADALALAITHLWRPTSVESVGRGNIGQPAGQPVGQSGKLNSPTSATQKWLAAEANAKKKNSRSW